MESKANWVAAAIVVALAYGLGLWWMNRSLRRWSKKGAAKRRLLVKEDGLPIWRTLRARVLVGWVDTKGDVTSGSWARSESGVSTSTWAVLQTAKGKLVAYRFDDYQPDEPKTGILQICDSWSALEAAVPANIFEEALLAAGIKKPTEYREAPLEL